MMSRASERFSLLLADVYAAGTSSNVFVVEAAHDTAGSALLYGADPASKLHIMAPIEPGYAFNSQSGKQIELTDWTHPESGVRYLDLTCESGHLTQVFSLLADSVVERMLSREELAHAALLGALHDWQELFRPARSLSEDAARGLFGELSVLAMLAERNPLYAVECWTGPDKGKHDFSTPNGDIEVKSSQRDALEVAISSLDQLDRINDARLTLVRLHVVSSPAGRNIGAVVDDLARRGCLRDELIQRMAGSGFLLGVDSDEHKFALDGPVLAWEVGEDFPGLRTSEIPEARRAAISHITYTLSLAGAPGQLDDEELRRRMNEMMSL